MCVSYLCESVCVSVCVCVFVYVHLCMCICACRVDRVTGNTLELSGVDVIDGTPILDVKPFIPSYDTPRTLHVCVYTHIHTVLFVDGNPFIPSDDTPYNLHFCVCIHTHPHISYPSYSAVYPLFWHPM